MTSTAERARLVRAARESITRGSKSFRAASRLFDRPTREKAWLLYAWCRACDDLADGQDHGRDAVMVANAGERLRYLTDQTERAIAGVPAGDPAFDGLAMLLGECPIPHNFLRDHIRGFALDAEGWRPQTEGDLLTYCYHVAGVVGCMMAVLMGVPAEDEDTLDRACDLGLAFQLANIARDITDDAVIGRCYIPADWLDEAGLTEAELATPAARAKLAPIARRLAGIAARHEASARIGAGRLPFRSAWAVLSAASIYGQIARDVAAAGPGAWDERIYVKRGKKLRQVVGAFGGALTAPRSAPRAGLWARPR